MQLQHFQIPLAMYKLYYNIKKITITIVQNYRYSERRFSGCGKKLETIFLYVNEYIFYKVYSLLKKIIKYILFILTIIPYDKQLLIFTLGSNDY